MKHFIIKNKLLSIEKMIKVNSLRYIGTALGCLALSWGVLWCPVVIRRTPETDFLGTETDISGYRNGPERTFVDTETDFLGTKTDFSGY